MEGFFGVFFLGRKKKAEKRKAKKKNTQTKQFTFLSVSICSFNKGFVEYVK